VLGKPASYLSISSKAALPRPQTLPIQPYRPTRGTIAALVAVGMVVMALVLFGRLPGHHRWAADISNAAHGPAFALLTLVVFALLRSLPQQRLSTLSEYTLAVLLAILLGAIVELVQHFTGRDAALFDIWTDALGALAAAGTLLVFDPRVRQTPALVSPRRVGFIVAIAACVLMVAPLTLTIAAYVKRHLDFPILADPRWPLATSLLHAGVSATIDRAELPQELQSDRRQSIGVRAHLTDRTGWAVVLAEPVSDWRGYTRLNLDLANPADEPLVLRLRVFDRRHGRNSGTGFGGSIKLAPRSRAIQSFALTKLTADAGATQLDTSRVASVVIARAHANRAREFYLVGIWLD